jgi:hypothetical protein
MQVTTVALLATTLVTAGCGGSSKSGSETSKPLTRTELIAQADPACGRINAKITYYTNLKPSNSQDLVSLSAAVRAAPVVSSTEREAQADLAKLTPPAGMTEDWKQIVAGVQTVADETQRYGESIQAKDAHGISAASASATRTLQRIRVLAARDGFVDCAKLAQ